MCIVTRHMRALGRFSYIRESMPVKSRSDVTFAEDVFLKLSTYTSISAYIRARSRSFATYAENVSFASRTLRNTAEGRPSANGKSCGVTVLRTWAFVAGSRRHGCRLSLGVNLALFVVAHVCYPHSLHYRQVQASRHFKYTLLLGVLIQAQSRQRQQLISHCCILDSSDISSTFDGR